MAAASTGVLMLVPVDRPADVPAAFGMYMTEVMPDAALTAVLRSWEERFGATLTAIGPGVMDLAVGAPPAGDEAALRLAYEIAAFAPEGDPISDVRGLREFAGTLRSQSVWRFGWPELSRTRTAPLHHCVRWFRRR